MDFQIFVVTSLGCYAGWLTSDCLRNGKSSTVKSGILYSVIIGLAFMIIEGVLL